MNTLKYEGLLSLHSHGEGDRILFLSSVEKPLAEELKSKIARKSVSVRYWITDRQCSRDDACEQFLRSLYGSADCDFGSHYSETTGYLWTDEEAKIGGHDLIQELKSAAGKWLILEIDVHEDPQPPGPS